MINRNEAEAIYLKNRGIVEIVDTLLKCEFEDKILDCAKTQRFAQVTLKGKTNLSLFNIAEVNMIYEKIKEHLEGLGYVVHIRQLNVTEDCVFDILF